VHSDDLLDSTHQVLLGLQVIVRKTEEEHTVLFHLEKKQIFHHQRLRFAWRRKVKIHLERAKFNYRTPLLSKPNTSKFVFEKKRE